MQNQSKYHQAMHSNTQEDKHKKTTVMLELSKSLDKIESLYGLDKEVKKFTARARLVKHLNAEDLNAYFMEQRSKISSITKRKRTMQVAAQMGVISYLLSIILFRGSIELDMTLHPHLKDIIPFLRMYTKYSERNLESKQDLNIVLHSLRTSENISKMRKNNDLIYRLLRLLYLLILFDDYLDASILSRFLLSQLESNNHHYSSQERRQYYGTNVHNHRFR